MAELPFVAVGLLVTAIGVVLALYPSLYLNLRWVREIYNPKLVSSPYFRVQMRALGLFFSLFGLVFMATTIQKLAAPYLPSLEQTLYVALIVIFFTVWSGGIVVWILEKLNVIRPSLKERYDSLTPEQDSIRQQKEVVVFASILAAVVLVCILMALK
jgi:hypothetical protein